MAPSQSSLRVAESVVSQADLSGAADACGPKESPTPFQHAVFATGTAKPAEKLFLPFSLCKQREAGFTSSLLHRKTCFHKKNFSDHLFCERGPERLKPRRAKSITFLSRPPSAVALSKARKERKRRRNAPKGCRPEGADGRSPFGGAARWTPAARWRDRRRARLASSGRPSWLLGRAERSGTAEGRWRSQPAERSEQKSPAGKRGCPAGL